MRCNSHNLNILRTPVFHTSTSQTILSTSALLQKQGGMPLSVPKWNSAARRSSGNAAPPRYLSC
jgi:hypothetical protein